MTAKVHEGTQIIHVGERPKGQKKYATDEYLLAPPGTIVAPRKRGEKPTTANAAKAIVAKGQELGVMPRKQTGPRFYKELQKAAFGTGVMAPQEHAVAPPPVAPAAPPAAAQTAAAPNPVAEALTAISQVAGQYGTDPTGAANILNQPLLAPANASVPFATGAGAFQSFLTQLLQSAGILGPDTMNAQLGVMQSMGAIDPRALGVTDPAMFRKLLAEGKGLPTLAAELGRRKQSFDETLHGFSTASPQRGNVPQIASS